MSGILAEREFLTALEISCQPAEIAFYTEAAGGPLAVNAFDHVVLAAAKVLESYHHEKINETNHSSYQSA